jgi:hypothetical protein
MDADHLLAVGRAGDENGLTGGVQVSVFDVSDFEHPTLAHKLVIGDKGNWGWSEALGDHHAFTFHRGVLSIPYYGYAWDDTLGFDRYTSGLIVLAVDAEEGITELGVVDHSDLVGQTTCPYEDKLPEGDERDYVCDEYYYGSWRAQIRRSVYLEDNLVSISTVGLKVSDLNAPSVTWASVVLE